MVITNIHGVYEELKVNYSKYGYILSTVEEDIKRDISKGLLIFCYSNGIEISEVSRGIFNIDDFDINTLNTVIKDAFKDSVERYIKEYKKELYTDELGISKEDYRPVREKVNTEECLQKLKDTFNEEEISSILNFFIYSYRG